MIKIVRIIKIMFRGVSQTVLVEDQKIAVWSHFGPRWQNFEIWAIFRSGPAGGIPLWCLPTIGFRPQRGSHKDGFAHPAQAGSSL